MEILNQIQHYGFWFLVVLTVLVFIHELGHFAVARWCKVRVEVFSIGFGPELFGWTDRTGTRLKFSWLPLGGYVRMFGQDENVIEGEASRPMSDAERGVSFKHKTVGQRMAIVFAGPAANYLFAFVLLVALYASVGKAVTPPAGYEAFCQREPQDCPAARGGAGFWSLAFGIRRPRGTSVVDPPSSIRGPAFAWRRARPSASLPAAPDNRAPLSRESIAVIEGVNRQVNGSLASASDWKIYGRRDYWAMPLSRPGRVTAGDCEDFVMEKRHRLLAAGFPMAQLSIALQGIVTQQLLPTSDGRGRVVACEVLIPTPAIRNLIREGKTHQIYAALQTSGATGMQTMDADLVRLVRAGKIGRALAEQRASVPEELNRLLGGAPVAANGAHA